MSNWAKALFTRYVEHHKSTGALLEWMGVIGAVAFVFLYFLRESRDFPLMYDDLIWRGVAIGLCVVLALRKHWPTAARRYYLAYSYLTVFYSLAFLLPFTLMHNNAITPTVANMVLSAVLIILLTDWRNSIAMLMGGYILSTAVYWITSPDPSLPIGFILWWLPLCAVLVASGSAAKYAEKRAEIQRMRVYAGLAGSIAHEMRTPLAQIQHALRCIDAEVSPESAAARAVQQGHSAIHRGLQSISLTLQQISLCEPPPIELQTLSAERCLRKALDEYAYDSPQARDCVQLHLEEDFLFRGNATALELVLFNLLKNALYYLPLHPHMEVIVTVKATPVPRIVVRDTGPGIAPQQVPRLFEEFHTDGKPEGTGLGLAFCRRTLNEWGGGIECRSEQGHFTEFTLSFTPATSPVPASAPTAPAKVADTPSRSPAAAARTVLIVDDQRFNRSIACALIGDLGLNAREAEHGQQALDMLQQGTMLPDVVLMDVNMPGLDGMATARLLRDIPGPAGRVPVFALTANDSPAVQAAAREARMQGVLAKPIDIEALKRALASTL